MADAMQRLRGMLGFAMRAGKLIIGTEIVCASMSNKHKPKIVVVSFGASDGTKKKISYKCEFYNIKMVQINISTDELGRLLGKTYSPAVIGIMDEGFANEIEKLSIGYP